jgi:hypothetical protein
MEMVLHPDTKDASDEEAVDELLWEEDVDPLDHSRVFDPSWTECGNDANDESGASKLDSMID